MTDPNNRYFASVAEAGLQKLEYNTDIALVITDCYMQGMSGFVFVIKIREHFSSEELAVIGISSQGGQSLSAQFIKSGANDFLLKP